MADDLQRLVLIVEDDPGVATLQRRRLQRAGFQVEVAGDVDGALEQLERRPFDLVVLDYRLGRTTGLDLHRRMKASGFEVPVIIVSGAMDDAMVIEAIRTGVRDVVVKNADYLDYLSDAVRSVLEQAARTPESASPQLRGANILVVEDDPAIATLERRQLERSGYQVSVATTPDQAIDVVRRGDTSLMILDLRLQGSASGLELYEGLKTEGWNIPAILVTAFADQAVAIRALRAGVRDFVPKTPDYLDYLPTAVDRVMAQVRVEHKLVESELRLASIIGTTMDSIVMCDEQSRIMLFNRSAEEMFGCEAGAALHEPLSRFFPGLTRDAGPEGTRGGSMRRRLEIEAVRFDGSAVPVEVSVSDVTVHGARLLTVIARDISERRRIEAELREADRRKDEFLGMLAHELRNPLAAIMTAGEVLNRMQPEEQAQRLIAVIRRQTRALARMVDDLLDVSRVTMGKIPLAAEPLLLSEVVIRAADGAREVMTRQELQFEVAVSDEHVWLRGDATRLEQVLSNLLNNAAKFTPAGGRVTLEAFRQGDAAVVRVADTGIGIDPAVLPRIFDLFVQADTSLDRSKSGLGIGLALVRKLVELHGGSVTASSAGVGQGAEFVIRLPALKEDGAGPQPDEPAEVRPTGALRVLVVDDQRDIADSVALLVTALGHHSRAVYDGRTALEVSRSDPPDVMIVDVGMPEVTGYDVARAVREDPELSGVQLVALTGYGREEDRARAQEAGFNIHLTKPVGEARLREVLTQMAFSN